LAAAQSWQAAPLSDQLGAGAAFVTVAAGNRVCECGGLKIIRLSNGSPLWPTLVQVNAHHSLLGLGLALLERESCAREASRLVGRVCCSIAPVASVEQSHKLDLVDARAIDQTWTADWKLS